MSVDLLTKPGEAFCVLRKVLHGIAVQGELDKKCRATSENLRPGAGTHPCLPPGDPPEQSHRLH